MSFIRLTVADLEYRQVFGSMEIRGFDIYNQQDELIGKVAGVLHDINNRSPLLVLDIGSWLSWKRVILPVTQFQIDAAQQRVYISGLTKENARELLVYDPNQLSERAAEEHQPETAVVNSTSLPSEASAIASTSPLEATRTITTTDRDITPVSASVSREEVNRLEVAAQEHRHDSTQAQTYSQSQVQQQEPNIQDSITSDLSNSALTSATTSPVALDSSSNDFPEPEVVDRIESKASLEQKTVQLLSERLIVDRQRRKIGEVIVRKEVETRWVEVPVRYEKLIIEQVSPERKQLAVVDMQDESYGVTLWEPATESSSAAVSEPTQLRQTDLEQNQLEQNQLEQKQFEQVMTGSAAEPNPTQAVSLALAAQILERLTQSAQFKNEQVQLVFSDSKLQTRYERWLQEHRT